MAPHRSDSSEQQGIIRSQVAAYLGKELQPRDFAPRKWSGGQVDGAAADESALVEIFARQRPLRGSQRHKVATDALKLMTIGKAGPARIS